VIHPVPATGGRLSAQSGAYGAVMNFEAGELRHMSKLALVATIKTFPGKRDEYPKYLKAHSKRYLTTEPGTLKFEIMVPHDQADTVLLYEVYASPEAFETHWNGAAKRRPIRTWSA
jgi:quinol monooxygenase YgiN